MYPLCFWHIAKRSNNFRLTVEEVEDLKRQRDELLKRKREKEELLASLGPEDVESLRLQRESLLATKKAKERELAQLIKKKDGLDKPSKGLKGTQPSILLYISQLQKKSTVTLDLYLYVPFPEETHFQTHLQNNVLEETRKQYLELKKEHKQDRQLMKDQKKRLEQAAQ